MVYKIGPYIRFLTIGHFLKRAKKLSQENGQSITFRFNLEGLDCSCRWSVDLFAVLGVGGLANAATLDCSCAGKARPELH
jgi:hypothetical protein